MNLLNRIINFFKNHYYIFLTLVVLVSYGQILWMQPWEDDNALFVKLSHIQDPVGYFGTGPLGSGVYKYAAVPFIPIYHFFGYNTVPYFALLIILYLIATLVIYKVFSYIFGKTPAMVSAFIFASGYVTSDGFWRMANSATTSISLVLISLFIGSYWKYYKCHDQKVEKIKWYFLTLTLFFVAVYYAISRDHYLFAIAVFFEIIFLAFQKPLVSTLNSLVRLVPFSLIFLRLLIFSGDARTGGVKDFITSVIHGNFYLTYGFFSSIANMIIPDYITTFIFDVQKRATVFLGYKIGFPQILLFVLSCLSIYLLFRETKKRKILLIFSYSVLFIWFFFAKSIYQITTLSIGDKDLYTVTMGGALTLLSFLIFFKLKKLKWLYLLFLGWFLTNIFAYSAYFPTVAYETVNRYLAHSFFALAAIFGILYSEIDRKNTFGMVLSALILVYGCINIVSAVVYQHKILISRSYPVQKFYKDLLTDLPKIDKGDVLYFDVSSDAQIPYRAAISAAMIPDSGSFAWRYGIGRYEFELLSNFEELSKFVTESKLDPKKIHSFWYSKSGLVDTTNEVQKYFLNRNNNQGTFQSKDVSKVFLAFNRIKNATNWSQPELNYNFTIPIDSTNPQGLEVTLVASPIPSIDNPFPIYSGNLLPDEKSSWRNESQKDLSLKYLIEMQNFVKNSVFQTDSIWQDRVTKNLFDNDFDTLWQPNRIEWQKHNSYIKVQLPTSQKINRVVWVNSSYNNSIPISYEISVSVDGVNWHLVKKITNEKFTGNPEYRIVTFEEIQAKYVKMLITDTLGEDSPMVSEFRVVSSALSNLDLVQSKKFTDDPFLYVSDYLTFSKTLQSFGYNIPARLYWFGNKENAWLTSKPSEFKIIYDDKPHTYKFVLPPGGTEINKIKISDIKIPGNLILTNVKYKSLNIKDSN